MADETKKEPPPEPPKKKMVIPPPDSGDTLKRGDMGGSGKERLKKGSD